MKKNVLYIISVLAAVLLTACEHKELCYHHPHTARVRIDVDWSEFKKEVPSGMTVMVYPQSGGEAIEHLTNTTTHALLDLPADTYHSITFNQSPSEYGSLSFRGMEKYETAEVYTNATKSVWYNTRGEEEILATSPEWLGTDQVKDMLVTREMVDVTGEHLLQQNPKAMPEFVIGTHTPLNIIHTLTVKVYVKGIYNLRSVRASLDGLAEGYRFAAGKPTTGIVTQLLEEWKATVDKEQPTEGYITTQITCFGLPDGHTAQADENEFILSVLLVDNKTVVKVPFKVGDLFEWLDQSDLHLLLELGPITLPDVKPEGGSESGFDVVVEDWGEEEDYEVGV